MRVMTTSPLARRQAARTFRVFVSSTFEDLREERDALQERVFPRLRRLCEKRGARFQAIDLRWGVSQEAALDQQTMPLCLEEIARSRRVSPRPNFIVLLGDRYGWRALPWEIPAAEFDRIHQWVTDSEDRELLKAWYRLDENALQPVWALQPRRVESGEEGEEEEKRWAGVERRLRQLLHRAVSELGFTEEQRVKYEASATEQEIIAGALSVEDAAQHVFCFLRTIEGLPTDESAKGYRDLDANGEPDPDARRLWRALRKRLREHVPGNVFEYTVRWAGNDVGHRRAGSAGQVSGRGPEISKEYLDKLCDDVCRCLEGVVLEELERLEHVDPLAQEIWAHAAFARERSGHFRGRAGPLREITRYLKGDSPTPLVVWGETGTGKSALLAKAIDRSREAFPTAETVSRFIGVTPRSSSGRDLLVDLCRQLSDLYGNERPEIPAHFSELADLLRERLAVAGRDRPLLLFIDALDQLREGDPGRELSWIPTELPDNVRLVVSTLPGDTLAPLQARLSSESFLEPGPMPVEEAEEVLGLWLEDAHRSLRREQREAVLRGFETCPRPLYLKLVFEEARRWRSYDPPRPLGPDVEGIIGDLLGRLSKEANHGRMMVERSLGYLAASKSGLTEDELLSVLSSDDAVMRDFRRRSPKSPEVTQLPVVVWSRLFFDLEPYLTELAADGTTLMAFYHPTSFGPVVKDTCLAGEAKPERHAYLARYFASCPLYADRDGERVFDQRKLSELPFQQTCAWSWRDLEETLTDLDFIEAKCSEGRTHELFGDYLLAGRTLREREAPVPVSLELYESCLRLNLGVLHRNPEVAFQQFYNQLYWEDQPKGPVARRFERIRALREELPGRAWLRRLGPPDYTRSGSIIHILEDCAHPIEELAVASDGSRAAAIGKKRGAIRWGTNRIFELVVWDLRSARVLLHLSDLYLAKLLPSGFAATCKDQGTLEVWDLTTATVVGTHPAEVADAPGGIAGLVPAGGGHAAGRLAWSTGSGSREHGERMLDRLTKMLPARERERLGEIEAATLLGKRHLLFAAGRRSLGCWDLLRGERIFLRTDLPCTFHVQFARDDETLVAMSDYHRNWGGDPHFWVIQPETLLAVPLYGHERPPHTLVFANEGRLLVSASHDGSCRLWDVERIGFGRGFSVRDGLPQGRGPQSHPPLAAGITDALEEDSPQEGALLGQSGAAVAIVGRDLAVFTSKGGYPASVLVNAGDDDLTCVIAHPGAPDVVFAGGYDTVIRAWNLRSGTMIAEYRGHSGTVRFLGISPDGSILVSTSEDESLAAWSVAGARLLWRTDIHSENLAAFSFGRTEPWLAFAGRSKGHELWIVDPVDGRALTFVPHRNIVRRVLYRDTDILTRDRSGGLAAFELRNAP